MWALVSRKGCHLCENTEALLQEVGLPYEYLDVDADPELRRLYTFRVPVLLHHGQVVMENHFSRDKLMKLKGE